jgi:hypothetical protein
MLELEPVVVTGEAAKRETPPAFGEVAFNCADEGDAAAVALLTRASPSPFIAALAALGIGYDVGSCVQKTLDALAEEAANARARAECTASGGTRSASSTTSSPASS